MSKEEYFRLARTGRGDADCVKAHVTKASVLAEFFFALTMMGRALCPVSSRNMKEY